MYAPSSPWRLSRRALVIAATLAAALALMMPAGGVRVAPASASYADA